MWSLYFTKKLVPFINISVLFSIPCGFYVVSHGLLSKAGFVQPLFHWFTNYTGHHTEAIYVKLIKFVVFLWLYYLLFYDIFYNKYWTYLRYISNGVMVCLLCTTIPGPYCFCLELSINAVLPNLLSYFKKKIRIGVNFNIMM